MLWGITWRSSMLLLSSEPSQHHSQFNVPCLFVFFPRQPKHTHVYGIPIRLHMRCPSWVQWICWSQYIFELKTCLFKPYEPSVKDPSVSHTSNERNEGPGNAPREKIPNELPVPMPSLEPPEKDGDDVMDQDLHVDDPKWKGYSNHGGNVHKKSPSGWWIVCRDSLLDIHGFLMIFVMWR